MSKKFGVVLFLLFVMGPVHYQAAHMETAALSFILPVVWQTLESQHETEDLVHVIFRDRPLGVHVLAIELHTAQLRSAPHPELQDLVHSLDQVLMNIHQHFDGRLAYTHASLSKEEKLLYDEIALLASALQEILTSNKKMQQPAQSSLLHV